jgi:hypothetical protein
VDRDSLGVQVDVGLVDETGLGVLLCLGMVSDLDGWVETTRYKSAEIQRVQFSTTYPSGQSNDSSGET